MAPGTISLVNALDQVIEHERGIRGTEELPTEFVEQAALELSSRCEGQTSTIQISRYNVAEICAAVNETINSCVNETQSAPSEEETVIMPSV